MEASHENSSHEKEKLMKQLRKNLTKTSETAASIINQSALDKDALSDVLDNNALKKSSETSKMLKQHLAAQKSGEIEMIEKFENMFLNGEFTMDDPYGDGDQTKLKGFEAMKLRTQWASGFDYNPALNENISEWCRVCYFGKLDEVKMIINITKSDDERTKLLERRETMIRFCAIFHVICGARMKPTNDHVEIAKLLVSNACNVNAKDVAGYTPLHHCVTQFGNDTTFEIARILLENGADVNAQNRFGCTPLFEPCMTFNYKFIELLVCNGSDPSIRDNDGISCQNLGSSNPKITSLFSKGYRAMAKAAKQADKNAGEDACSYCQKSGKLSRCSGCMSVQYCSRACQTYDWKNHKPICKSLHQDKKAAGSFVYVKPVRNPYGEEVVLFNERTKSVDVTKKNAGKKSNHEEKAMRVKIQVPLAQGVAGNGPMLVYNKDKSYQCYIVPQDENYKAVYSKVVEKGFGGIKAYFASMLKKNGDLQLDLSKSFSDTF